MQLKTLCKKRKLLNPQTLRIMKITAFLICAFFVHVSAATLAQTVSLSEHKASLEKVINDIKQQTGYSFFYNQDWLQKAKPVDLVVKNQPLETVLKACFADQPVDFAVVNQTIVLKLKEAPVSSPNGSAQTTLIAYVVDELGKPMPGVNIRQKDLPTNGTTTDAKGRFSITVPDDQTALIFSYIGYETQELAAKYIPTGSNVTMKVAENNLQEVVVNKGYYFERKELSTGDETVVSSKEIEQQPVSDPIQALEGKVAGLYISQQSGMPGAYATVRINGQNSIANGNNPLYVIDGVPFNSNSLTNTFIGGGAVGQPATFNGAGISPFNALNPDDIESITVLKDADATSIYGSQGANGVVLITTKKGKVGDTKVDFDISQGDGQVTRMMNLMNTQQYLQMRHQAFANDGLSVPSLATNAGDQNYDINGAWDTTRNTNWQKVFIGNTAHYTNAQLSVSGGTENTQFYVGAGFNRQTTVFPGDYNDGKGSLNFNITHSSANKRFQLQFSGGYIYDNDLLPQSDFTGAALTLAPDAPALYTSNGALNWQPAGGSTYTWLNPLAGTLETASAVTNNVMGHMQLSYELMPGLKLSSSFGFNDDRMGQSLQQPAGIYPPPYNNNPYTRTNNFGTTEYRTWLIEPTLSYDRSIGKGQLSVLAGTTLQQNVSNSSGYYAYGFSSDALIPNPTNASSFSPAGYNNTEYRYNAVYGRINYTWDDKYILNVTARRDGSSRFGPGDQWGNFGAVGAGWIFGKEAWVKENLPWLSFGKLRGSFGVTGNDQITDYQYLSTYSTISTTYQGTTGLYPTRIPNPYYGWETDKKLEGGIELGFLKDRINLTADYYRERSANQLVPYALPYTTGFTSVEENLPAIVQNTAAEFTLNTVNVKSRNLIWTTSVNLTLPQNKLISYPGLAASNYKYTYAIGYPLSMNEAYQYLGVNPQTGVDQYFSPTGPTNNPTRPPDNVDYIATTQKFYGGFGNTLRYKDFELDVFFQFVKQTQANYFSVATPSYAGQENYNMPAILVNNTWTQPGNQSPYGKLSTVSAGDPNNSYQSSNAAFGDASFIRLKNLAFSWQLPKSWQNAAHLQNTRIYLQAQNLVTFSHYLGLDPESGPNGLPPLRMITLGIHTSL